MYSQFPFDNVQYFRVTPSSPLVTVNVGLDQNTGERFIKWQDIQLAFGNVKKVFCENKPVEIYTKDENGAMITRRIKHHPGIVLDVMLSAKDAPRHSINSANGNGQTISFHTDDNEPVSRPSTPFSTRPSSPLSTRPSTPLSNSSSQKTSYSLPSSLSNRRVAQNQQTPLYLPDFSSTRNFHAPQPLLMSPQGQSFYQQYNDVCNDYFDAIDVGNDDQAKKHAEEAKMIMDKIHHQFDKIFIEIERNSNAQFNMVEIQKEIKRMQQEMLDMQKQALDQLMNMRDRIQAVLTQTYELHEYPIPRLFIVLPRPTNSFKGNIFARQFRLYFLCECGRSTKSSKADPSPPEIHLSNHGGYDLECPNEFFEKYGNYVMTMLQMLKFGCMAAGVVTPAIDTIKIVDGIQAVEERFGKMQFGSLVDETISYLQGVQKKSSANEKVSQIKSPFENVKALEGVELRQLQAFLRVNDGERSLGNLYRIVTDSGNVKWVCRDHYPSSFRASSNSDLLEFVESKGGEYLEGIGKIKIRVETPAEAKALYDSLLKSRGIQELELKLNWDATKDDLKKLVTCLSGTNIACLYIDGKQFDGPTKDVSNRRRRFNQIVHLMNSERIQTLKLSEFSRFYDRISIDDMGISNRLRVLSIGMTNISGEPHCKPVLTKILEKMSGLHSLELVTTEAPHHLTKFISTKYSTRHTLDVANVSLADKTITVTLAFNPANIVTAPTASTIDTPRGTVPPSRPTKFTAIIKSLDQSQDCRKKILSVYAVCGYAVEELEKTWIFGDELSKTLSDIIYKHSFSRLTTLQVDAWNLSSVGLSDLYLALQFQRHLRRFDLVFCLLSQENQRSKLEFLRDIVKEKVTSLTFKGTAPDSWLPLIREAIQNKQEVPKLEALKIESRAPFPKKFIPWISEILSDSSKQPVHTRHPLTPIGYSLRETMMSDKPQPLKAFTFGAVTLESQDWKTIIDNLDFNSLQEISFWSSNFTLESLNDFIVRLDATDGKYALKTVDLCGTLATYDGSMNIRDLQFERLRGKVKNLIVSSSP